MTWTDDKEAEHQRIRADFAEAEVERLRGAVQRVRDLRQRLIDADQGDGYPPESSVWVLDQVLALFDRDVPRVTDAERAEAQRVHEGVTPTQTDP